MKLIIGSGITGVSAARWLLHQGHAVRLYDKKPADLPKEFQTDFKGRFEFHSGKPNLSYLEGIDELIPSPGVSLRHPLIVEAMRTALPITSEIDVGLRNYRGRVIAVTGTNGKSTVCYLIHQILTELGVDHALLGNFGTPPCAYLNDHSGHLPPYIVLEISSYQLETTKHLKPRVSVFTSFSEDHLERHDTMAAYFDCKWTLLKKTDPQGINLISPSVQKWSRDLGYNNKAIQAPIEVIDLAQCAHPELLGVDTAFLSTSHNRINMLFAMEAVRSLFPSTLAKHPPQDIAQKLTGLEHRFEPCHTSTKAEPWIINDSKSTNLESSITAIKSMPEPFLLLLGGKAKTEPFADVLGHLHPKSRVIAFGEANASISKDLGSDLCPHQFPKLKPAVEKAWQLQKELGYPILFSPGCASFDEFSNFEERGKVFKDIISGLQLGTPRDGT